MDINYIDKKELERVLLNESLIKDNMSIFKEFLSSFETITHFGDGSITIGNTLIKWWTPGGALDIDEPCYQVFKRH